MNVCLSLLMVFKNGLNLVLVRDLACLQEFPDSASDGAQAAAVGFQI